MPGKQKETDIYIYEQCENLLAKYQREETAIPVSNKSSWQFPQQADG
jgi:hypothetical protein